MRNLYKMLAVICLFSGGHALAETPLPAPINFIGKYYFSWAGLHLGDIELSIQEKTDSYELRLAVTSGGMVNWFTRHESDTTVTGKRSATKYQPALYKSRYKTKNKPRHIRLQFDAAGKVTEELNEPPENRALRPEVPAKLKDGAYDPLTTLMVIRSGLVNFPAFDAKRLYKVLATPGSESIISVLGTDTPVQDYVLSRTAIAGLTEKEQKEYDSGEPPLHFYVSKEARHIPVYMTMPIFMGNVKGSLTKECKTWDECKVK